MIQRLQQHALPIVIAVAFYVSGFFATASLLTLSTRDIVIGLFAGAIGGLACSSRSGERTASRQLLARFDLTRADAPSRGWSTSARAEAGNFNVVRVPSGGGLAQ